MAKRKEGRSSIKGRKKVRQKHEKKNGKGRRSKKQDERKEGRKGAIGSIRKGGMESEAG